MDRVTQASDLDEDAASSMAVDEVHAVRQPSTTPLPSAQARESASDADAVTKSGSIDHVNGVRDVDRRLWRR